MTTFSRRKNTLTTALVHHKMYFVVQLPHMKKYFRQKKWIVHDGFLRSKMSVSDSLVDNIALPTRLLPTDIDGFLLSALLIDDGFLCCCDKLWPSLIAIFFVVAIDYSKLLKIKYNILLKLYFFFQLKNSNSLYSFIIFISCIYYFKWSDKKKIEHLILGIM